MGISSIYGCLVIFCWPVGYVIKFVYGRRPGSRFYFFQNFPKRCLALGGICLRQFPAALTTANIQVSFSALGISRRALYCPEAPRQAIHGHLIGFNLVGNGFKGHHLGFGRSQLYYLLSHPSSSAYCTDDFFRTTDGPVVSGRYAYEDSLANFDLGW
ncbi:hypothetical protein ES703_19440 [subsurface metagenome]